MKIIIYFNSVLVMMVYTYEKIFWLTNDSFIDLQARSWLYFVSKFSILLNI